MTMLASWREVRERRRQDKEYGESLKDPVHRMLMVTLTKALEARATGICFGYRGDWAAAADKESTDEEIMAFASEVGWPAARPEVARAVQESANFRGPERARGIPMWHEVDGELVAWRWMPAQLYVLMLAGIGDRLVSVGGTEAAPRPRKYVELKPEDGMRRFVEVAIGWDIQDAFWIRILSERRVGDGVNVSRGFW